MTEDGTQLPAAANADFPGESEEEIQRELKKWNWGAFFLTWIWGIGNGTLVALLALLPFINFVMMPILGLKGNAWAWKKRTWHSLAHFRDTQRRWAKWGAIVGIAIFVGFPLLFAGIVTSVMSLLKNSEPYQLSWKILNADPQVRATLGEPLKAGFFITGSMQDQGNEGYVGMRYSVKGPRESGLVYVEAYQKNGVWSYELIGVEMGPEKKRLNLTPGGEVSPPAPEAEGAAALPVPSEVPATQTSRIGSLQRVHLKNGNEVQGTLIRENDKEIAMQTRDLGAIIFSRDEIDSIQEEGL